MEKFSFGFNIKPKMVGEFNASDPSEWTLLIKPQIKDDTLFVHIQCEWKRKLSEFEIEAGITEPPMRIIINTGFMKDGQFVLSNTANSAGGRHSTMAQTLKTYAQLLSDYQSAGYIKHGEMYLGSKDPEEPTYRSSKGGNMANVANFMNGPNMVALGTANNPPKNPLIMLKNLKQSQSPNTNQNP